MSALDRFRQFKPPGPVAAAFLSDRRHQVRALLGPQGGGKSVSCIFDLLMNASQMPVCRDGVIRFKVAIIRDTYGRLEQTTIPTWVHWLPKDGGDWTEAEFVGGGGRQATHKIQFDVLRQSQRVPVYFEAIFAAIGDQAAEDFMRGFEVTAFWLNEMDLLPEDVLTLGIGRIGRYPSIEMLPQNTPLRGFPGYTLGKLPPDLTYETLPSGALYRDFIIGDLNAPDIDSWFYRRFEEDRADGVALYKQPGGRSPNAENLRNLKPGYYTDQVRLNASKRHWIRRFVDAQYGPSLDGEPVYAEDYSDDVHYAREPLEVLANAPLEIGLDAGLQRPAGILGQQSSKGQFRVLAEIVPGRCSPRRFAEAVKRTVAERAPGRRIDMGWADPAGFSGADKEDGDLAWAETVMLELGCPIEPAPAQELDLRLGAVKDELSYMIEAGVPALTIDPSCKLLRKGF
ncbi:MAG: hypothetical protein WCZ28_06030, partial [Burkholderiaceae bacterium]